MYSESITLAEETLTTNEKVRAHAVLLVADAKVLMVTYRRHRFTQLAGGTDTSDDRVPAILRRFCSGADRPRSFVGYSRGGVCDACGNGIKTQEIEYDVVSSASSLRLDEACYKVFMQVLEPDHGHNGRR